MAEAFRGDIWAEARRLVVAEGWEYAAVAEELGLALSTLQKHAAKEGWREERKQAVSYATQARRLKALTLDIAEKALAKAKEEDSLDGLIKAGQLAYLWKGMEQAFPEHRYQRPEEDEKPDKMAAMSDEELRAIIARGGKV